VTPKAGIEGRAADTPPLSETPAQRLRRGEFRKRAVQDGAFPEGPSVFQFPGRLQTRCAPDNMNANPRDWCMRPPSQCRIWGR